MKIPNDGAVRIVVTPVARFASTSSSESFASRIATKAGDVSGNCSVAALCGRAAAPRPRRAGVPDGNPSDVCASMRPG